MKKWWRLFILAGFLSILMIPPDQIFSETISASKDIGSVTVKENLPTRLGAEVGSDFRLSSMGPDGNAAIDAETPAVAYNSNGNQFLVVWSGDNTTNEEFEIWGQRVNATNGAKIGDNFRISSMGPTGDIDFDAKDPAVVYNSAANEYLVVWSGDHFADGDFEIWAQRVSGSTGNLIGG